MPVQELLDFGNTGNEIFYEHSMAGMPYNKKESNASSHHCVPFILPVADALIF